jgi:hypothetical protein
MSDYLQHGNIRNLAEVTLEEVRESGSSPEAYERAVGLAAGLAFWFSGDYEGLGEEALVALSAALPGMTTDLPPLRHARLLFAHGDLMDRVAEACGGYATSAPTFKAALGVLPRETAPQLWSELQLRYGTAYWLQHGLEEPEHLAEVIGAFRLGLEALDRRPANLRLRSFLLRALREVLSEDGERVEETLRVCDEEIALLATDPSRYHDSISAQNEKAAFLAMVGERRRDPSRLDQALAIYRAAFAALEQATPEQRHTPEWLLLSQILPKSVARTEAARAQLRR